MTEEEAEQLDEASITDDEIAERLRIAEDDLVDAYVRGNLDAATLERFEFYYLSSPVRREHVKFAARLIGAVDRVSPRVDGESRAVSSGSGGAEPPVGSTGVALAPKRAALRSWMIPGLAAAAALLLGVSVVLFYETVRLNRGLDVARQRGVTVGQRANELARQLDEQRATTAAAASEPVRVRESGPASSSPSSSGRAATVPAIALVLLPQTRAIGPIPTLSLASGADRVAFDLQLETNDFREYQVGLRDPATNEVIWRSEWTAPRTHDDQASVSLAIPALLLKPQHFAIELTGRDGASGGHVVGSYAFQIVPR